MPLAKLVRASTADREAKRNHFKSQLCSYCSQGGGETHPYLFITVGDIPDLVPWEGDFRGQPVVWVINVETQGINSKEQLCALFILQEERKEEKSQGRSDMNHCSLLSQPRAVTQHWVPGAAASPQHRWCPQMPPPSSPGSPGHGVYPGRKTGPPTHPTHPDGKVVHTIHLQVLGYLQILHFGFISVRQQQCLGGSERDMAAPADPKHSPGFKAWTVSITQVNPVFADRINKVQEQIPLCSCQHLSGC